MVKTSKKYSPERGDVIWLDFSPTLGHEQNDRRPGLVVSSTQYNRKIGLALVCPITTRSKKYPFEVPISVGSTSSYILADHLRSVDLQHRNAEFIEKASPDVLRTVKRHIEQLIAE